eukprot:TRINITY_DN26169_c0_g1_i1.p1 TRINITY_DN26169_c0_g1~~TRINITY_DN26169_c0_g1_i1.p1  ORF type:complete len:107 (-),score=4.97 TRINITY_DN26169_c0_g1_i1:53-373(-)
MNIFVLSQFIIIIKSDYIEDDVFELSHEYKFGSYRGDIMNINQEVSVKKNNFIVFNNNMGFVHHLASLKSTSRKYITKRKILAFFWWIQNFLNINWRKSKPPEILL